MRVGLIVVGIVLLVVGAVLLFVPVVPQTETANSASDTPYYAASVSGFSLTGSIAVSVSWSTNGTVPVNVLAASASGNCSSASSISGIVSENGTSGSFTLSQPNGGCIVMGVLYGGSPVTVTFKITTALSTVGTILIPVGVILLILGAVLGRSPKSAAVPPPMMAPPPVPPPPGPPPSG